MSKQPMHANTTTPAILKTTAGELMTLAGPWAGMIGAWLAEVRERTGSDRTPTEYGRYAMHFARMLQENGRSLAEATPADAQTFAYAALPDRRRGGELGKSPGPASVNVRLAAIRSLYDFAQRFNLMTANPADRVKRPRLPQPTPKGLTPQQIHELLAAIPDTPGGLRDRAIVLTAVWTGLRREELIGLTAASIGIDDDGTPMYTARTKGGKLRYRELPRPAWDAIAAYLETDGRPLELMDDDAPIFASPIRPGEAIAGQTLYENLKRYGEAIGVDGLTIHSLRHTAAKLRRKAGASLEEVQSVLGHSNVATTARYLARLEGTRDTGWAAAAAMLAEAATT